MPARGTAAGNPRAPYKRRTQREKMAAVLAADMVGVTAAAEQTGIPHETISSWMDRPEFAEFRRNARESMAEEVTIVARLAWRRVAEGLRDGSFEPRDAIFAAEKATVAMQLLSGQATERTEHVALTDGLDDHEKVQLRETIQNHLREVEA